MRIFILGSGNVSWHLTQGFAKAGHAIDGIYSRNIQHADDLAVKIGTVAYSRVEDIPESSDLYIICTSDSAIQLIADELMQIKKPVVHTSGSISVQVLSKFSQFGVFYPLQTFSRQRSVDLKQVPICIESNSSEFYKVLEQLAFSISEHVIQLDSSRRLQCHLAAVFANNFVNHFYLLSKNILEEQNISFDLIKPLIYETALKAIEIGPELAQTGPAKRGDKDILQSHLDLLSTDHIKKMYSFVSDSIMTNYQTK